MNFIQNLDSEEWMGKRRGGREARLHKGGEQQNSIWLYCQGARAHSAQSRLFYFGSFQFKFILSTTDLHLS